MNKVATGFCVLLGFAALLPAADRKGNLELGLNLGVSTYWGDIEGGEFHPYGDVTADWWWTDRLAFGLRGSGTLLRAEENDVGFQTPANAFNIHLKFLPFNEMKINPYLTGGLEYGSFNPEDSDNEDVNPPYHSAATFEKTYLAIPLGLGLSHSISDSWSVSVEGLYHHTDTDWIDDIEIGDANDGYFSFSLGLAYLFGKPKDTDGDGILDKLDKCPTQPEDMDGFEDTDGCPDLDNDKDGVPDVSDGAPLDAEDKDGFQDADGVPDPDNDGDGILDVNDKAPNDPEDFDGFQDEDGAPELDNDNDGIPDATDKCPNEVETLNGYKDDDGCPDKRPEIAVEAGKAIVLEGVTFESGKSLLKPESEETLGKVLRTLQENPEIEVEIRGYTDDEGKAEMNRKLSQDRSDAVEAWLVERGIDTARIQTKGFGPADPVADNTTSEGRAMNRRIEFFRVK